MPPALREAPVSTPLPPSKRHKEGALPAWFGHHHQHPRAILLPLTFLSLPQIPRRFKPCTARRLRLRFQIHEHTPTRLAPCRLRPAFLLPRQSRAKGQRPRSLQQSPPALTTHLLTRVPFAILLIQQIPHAWRRESSPGPPRSSHLTAAKPLNGTKSGQQHFPFACHLPGSDTPTVLSRAAQFVFKTLFFLSFF